MAGPYYIDGSIGSGGAGTSGNPYGSWSAFLTGVAGSLSGLGEVVVYLKNKCTVGNATATEFTAAGFSGENSSNYIHLKPWPGFEGTGTISTTPGFECTSTAYQNPLYRFNQYWRATQVAFNDLSTASGGNRATYVSASGQQINGCLFSSPGHCFTIYDNVTVQNSLFIQGNGHDAVGAITYSGTWSFLGNTIIATSAGGTALNAGAPGTAIVKNNAVYGSFTTEFSGAVTWDASSTNNAGQLASGSQPANLRTNYVQLTSSPFVNYAGGNYAPTTSGLLSNAGANSVTSVDAINTARGTPPEIGYLEATVAAASATIVFNSSINQRETMITLQTYGTSSTG